MTRHVCSLRELHDLCDVHPLDTLFLLASSSVRGWRGKRDKQVPAVFWPLLYTEDENGSKLYCRVKQKKRQLQAP